MVQADFHYLIQGASLGHYFLGWTGGANRCRAHPGFQDEVVPGSLWRRHDLSFPDERDPSGASLLLTNLASSDAFL